LWSRIQEATDLLILARSRKQFDREFALESWNVWYVLFVTITFHAGRKTPGAKYSNEVRIIYTDGDELERGTDFDHWRRSPESSVSIGRNYRSDSITRETQKHPPHFCFIRDLRSRYVIAILNFESTDVTYVRSRLVVRIAQTHTLDVSREQCSPYFGLAPFKHSRASCQKKSKMIVKAPPDREQHQ